MDFEDFPGQVDGSYGLSISVTVHHIYK